MQGGPKVHCCQSKVNKQRLNVIFFIFQVSYNFLLYLYNNFLCMYLYKKLYLYNKNFCICITICLYLYKQFLAESRQKSVCLQLLLCNQGALPVILSFSLLNWVHYQFYKNAPPVQGSRKTSTITSF